MSAKVTRIDFIVSPTCIRVIKFPEGHHPGDPYAGLSDYPTTWDMENALEWCEAHGWSVFRWPGGARAFLGKPWPIRTTAEIRRMRQRLEQRPLPEPVGRGYGYDLAFCL